MKKFEIVKDLSNNDIIRSWVVEDPKDKSKYFLKSINPESDFDKIVLNSILVNSFKLQQNIKNSQFVLSSHKFKEEGEIYFLYPYLNHNKWQVLTPELLNNNPIGILTEMCIIIDYLHFLNLVHGDLKLSNFLINKSNNKVNLRLIDFDFLCKNESKPNRKIFGTPDYIAPEINNNEIILTQSDNYSIGKALCDFKNSLLDNNKSQISFDNFNVFLDSLTNPDPLLRPLYLIDALKQNDLINEEKYNECNLKLISSLLLRSFNKYRISPKNNNILSENNILGISNELVNDFTFAYNSNPLKTFKVFSSLIKLSEIDRYNEYWHIQYDDELLLKTFKSLYSINIKKTNFFIYDPNSSDRQFILDEAIQYENNKEYQKAYLIYRYICDSELIYNYDNHIKNELYDKLADLLISQNRINEALKNLNILLLILSEGSESYLRVYNEIARYQFSIGNSDIGVEMIAKGIEYSKKYNNKEYELKFLRLNSWHYASNSKYDEAINILNAVFETSKEDNLYESLSQTYCAYGSIYRLKGNYIISRDYFLKSYDNAITNKILNKNISTLLALSMVNKYLGDYESVIKYGKLAFEHIDDLKDKIKLVNVCINMAYAYVYLGDFKKAREYQFKSLSLIQSNNFSNNFINFYHCTDMIYREMGDLDNARKVILNKLKMLNSPLFDDIKGNSFLDLAVISFYKSDVKESELYLEKAKNIFTVLCNDSSLLKVEFWNILSQHYYRDSHKYKELINLLSKFLEINNYYYAVLCFYHNVISKPSEVIIDAIIIEKIRNIVQDSETPLFKAVSYLVSSLDGNKPPGLYEYKQCYKIFDKIGAKYLACITCEKIADIYYDESKEKLAMKFYRRAMFIAESINNKIISERLTNKLESKNIINNDRLNVIKSMFGISKIIGDIKDHNKAIKEVVQYAIDQTGAERGVLLTKINGSNNLKVEAYLNCDDNSLIDIVDFSKSIPEHVDLKQIPFIIENAVKDKRTKNYKSIVKNNILSVICIPLKITNSCTGILYLDHHTIPALFDEEDVLYVSAIANILSNILSSIMDFKDISIINRQLVEEISSHDNYYNFIGKDPAVKELFSRLPEMAMTDAPILLIGESGTGKEIITNNIYKLCNRSDKPLVKVNCAAISDTLIESELFGISKNVATGVDKRDGKFAAADGGTIFFDEIGDMSLNIQAKVLRVIEYGEYHRVGSNKPAFTDVRYIYATNKNIKQLIKEKKFREDLYYRINTIVINIPPLRDRPGDINILLDYFLNKYRKGLNSSVFTLDAITALNLYNWPGNVRELKNIIERCCIFYDGNNIDFQQLPSTIIEYVPAIEDKKKIESMEKIKIINVLMKYNGNITKAAEELGMPRTTLNYKIKNLKIYNHSILTNRPNL